MKHSMSIILGLVFLYTLAGPAPASPAAAVATSRSVQQTADPDSTPVLADSWFSRFYRGLVSSLRSRKAMFQFALVGMLVALWIIWWRK